MPGVTEPSFDLAAEVQRIKNSCASHMPEAAVFYAGRVLEVVFRRVAATVGGLSSPNSFSNIERVNQWGLIDRLHHQLAHSLRRLANDARHVLREIPPVESQLAAAIIERLSAWYTIDAIIFSGDTACDLSGEFGFVDRKLRELIDVLIKDGPAASLGGQDVDQALDAFPQSHVLSYLLIEKCHRLKLLDEAERRIARTYDLSGPTLRLSQLQALTLSRRSQAANLNAGERLQMLQNANDLLKPLYARYGDDDETFGIHAGIKKRLWETASSPAQTEFALRALKDSRDFYAKGWKSSKETNVYLGINVAATALWSNEKSQSEATALRVLDLIAVKRKWALTTGTVDKLKEGFWDLVTEAEALLLAGRVAEARHAYQSAFQRFPKDIGDHEVARKQADRTLEQLDLARLG